MLQNKTYPDLSLLLEQVNKEEVIRHIPIIVAVVIFSAIGLPGNGLVCYIYGVKSTITTSSRWFIFFLGCANCVQCVIVIPVEIITIFLQYNFNNGACKTTSFLYCTSLVVMFFTLVIVAIDRHRKICRPHGWQIKLRAAKRLTIVIVVLAILISLPCFWVYEEKSGLLVVEEHNITVITCGFSDAALAFYYGLFGMTLATVCLATTCLLYCWIRRDIKRQAHKEQKRRGVTMTNHHGIPPKTSGKTIIEVFRLQTLKTMRNKDGNSEMETEIPKQNNATCTGQENSTTTTSGTTTCEDEGELAYYHQSTSQIQPQKPLVLKKVGKTTLSLFLISLAFVLSYLPTGILLLIRTVNSEFEASLNGAERTVCKFLLRSGGLYCVANPVLLAISDTGFRTQCIDILRQGWKRLTCQT